jgi:hypothetical protein
MTESFWHEIGVDRVAFISGAIGGFLSLRWLVPISPWNGAFAVLFAGVISNYSAAPVHQYFAIRGLHEGGVGMFIGLFALSLAAAIFKGLGELQLADILKKIIGRWTGG